MIARTMPSVSYAMWLKRILDAHISQTWDAEPTGDRERADEELEDVWTDISDQHKQRLWGLSLDLNSLRDQEKWVESDWPPMTKEELGRAQTNAFQRKQWDKLLECLRRPPRFLPQNMVDYLRGRAWMEMGHPEVALVFFDNASRLEVGNSTYQVLALECLKTIQDWPELLRRCELYIHDSKTLPRLLFRAADAFHVYANQSADQAYYERALGAVEEGFRRSKTGQQEQMASILAGAYATKSLCLEHLGRSMEALNVFDEAISRLPDNTTLRTARGLLRQELGRADAIDDFRSAVSRGTVVGWAYAEVARHSLQRRMYREAVDVIRQGIALARRDSSTAILFELLAIAVFHSGNSKDEVRTAFQLASELDPFNIEIQVNRQSFESFTAQTPASEPKWRLDSAIPPSAIDELYSQLQAAA